MFVFFCLFLKLSRSTNQFSFLCFFLLNSFFLQYQSNQNTNEGHRDEARGLIEQLRTQEDTVQDLKEQLALAKMNLNDAEIKYATQVHKKAFIFLCFSLHR